MEQHQQEYKQNGYTVYRNFFGNEIIDLVNVVVDRLEETLPINEEVFDESGTGKIKQIQYLDKRAKVFPELIEMIRSHICPFQSK